MASVNLTVSIPTELRNKMRDFPHVNWSAAVREVIKKTIADFEALERIASKSKLTQKDVDELSAKVDRALASHARKLLNEARG